MTEEDEIELEDELAAFNAVVEASNEFSSSLFTYLMEGCSGNLISSPLSAALVLAMAGYGARGKTKHQFKKVLCLPTPDSLAYTGYQKLIDTLNNIKENKVFLANKMFVTEKCSVKPTYDELTKTYFRSATQLMDFEENEEATKRINTWARQSMNNRMKNLISASWLSEKTSMILVNAIYFKGQWQYKFSSQFDMEFHVTKDTTKNIRMMFCNCDCRYGEYLDMDVQFVQIPFRGEELSMVIVVPNEIDGLLEIEAKLQYTSLTSILQRGRMQQINLYLPKFKTESEIELNSLLKKMGLTDAFDNSADFSGISDGPLMISKVVQKAIIEIDEEGSEITSKRIETFANGVIYPSSVFKVDRPSYYAIYHNFTHLVLFSGLIAF